MKENISAAVPPAQDRKTSPGLSTNELKWRLLSQISRAAALSSGVFDSLALEKVPKLPNCQNGDTNSIQNVVLCLSEIGDFDYPYLRELCCDYKEKKETNMLLFFLCFSPFLV